MRTITRALANPSWFARDLLGHDPWDTPLTILRALNRPRAQVAVKACHASAKTFTAAEAVLWWVFGQQGIVITTAPTWSQVRKLLWAEVHKAHRASRYPLGGTLNQVELSVSPDIYAMGLSTNEGVRFQGFHGKVLLVIDEAPGVREDIFDAIDGIRAGGDVRTLMLGNPILSTGRFHNAFTGERDLWHTVTIDAFDTPNLQGITLDELRGIPLGADDPRLFATVRPYLVTRQWVHEKLHTWGEQSPLWESKVRGQFPSQSDDALISLMWLERAKRANELPPEKGAPSKVGGLDVAGPGEDETVLTIRQGGAILGQHIWHDADPRGAVLATLQRAGVTSVNVDSIGIGYYMARHLADNGITVTDINVGESARDSEKYANLKAELYWGLRLRFEADEITGMVDDVTIGQLAGIRYKHNARGQILIESKEDARKRGVKSPDRAESVMLAFAPDRRKPRVAAPAMAHTSTWS